VSARTFRVWSPHAAAVEVETALGRQPMAAVGTGWWTCDIDGLGECVDYWFRLDGGEAMPDPRSRAQPTGVHGPSRLVEVAPPVQPEQWRSFPLRDAIIYELHVGTFTPEGTFDAAITRLEHLLRLGVNAIELMPVVEFAGSRGWGYDGVDLYAPHSAYGGPDGLRRLVAACHARGIAVIIDVVYNHTGPEGDYLAAFGPYFTDRYATPWGTAVNYDGAYSDDVRRFVLDNAEMWLRDYGCDGLRLDAVHAIIDTSPTHILEAITVRVDELAAELDRELWVIAESDSNNPRLVRDRDAGGYGLHAQWSDDFHHALHTLLTGEDFGYYEDFGGLADVCTALQRVFVYAGKYSHHRKHTVGRPVGDLPHSRFIAYSQNHDQVGNRAAGERLCHLVSAGRCCMAAALTLLSPMIPLLFQGEEWAAGTPFQYFTNLGDQSLARAVTNGRRSEFKAFGWPPESVPDPQDPATFARSKLNWDEPDQSGHAEMLAWYQEVIALRRATPGFAGGGMAEPHAWYDTARALLLYSHAGLLVVCNLGERAADLPEAGDDTLVMSSASVAGDAYPSIAADSVAIWRRA
jgi:maltooligosyltrehalose trehalohydrolase